MKNSLSRQPSDQDGDQLSGAYLPVPPEFVVPSVHGVSRLSPQDRAILHEQSHQNLVAAAQTLQIVARNLRGLGAILSEEEDPLSVAWADLDDASSSTFSEVSGKVVSRIKKIEKLQKSQREIGKPRSFGLANLHVSNFDKRRIIMLILAVTLVILAINYGSIPFISG